MIAVSLDVGALRKHLLDICGPAMMSGLPVAMLDIVEIEQASGEELCRIAERMDVNLRSFAVSSKEQTV